MNVPNELRDTAGEASAPRRRRIDPRWAAWLLPVWVAVVVAAVQIARAEIGGVLSPDRGGGFGMFATVDKSNLRVLRAVFVSRDGRPAAVPIRQGTDVSVYDYYRAHSHPTGERLEAVARALAERHAGQPIAQIHVFVYRLTFDGETNVVGKEVIAQHVMEFAP